MYLLDKVMKLSVEKEQIMPDILTLMKTFLECLRRNELTLKSLVSGSEHPNEVLALMDCNTKLIPQVVGMLSDTYFEEVDFCLNEGLVRLGDSG